MGTSDRRNGDIAEPGLEPETVDLEARGDSFFAALPTRDLPYKAGAGRGMYLQVMPNGSKYWRLKYRIAGKDRPYAIGVFPEIGVVAARAARDEAREWVRQGLDPRVEREASKARARAEQDETFAAMAERWFKEQAPRWSPSHRQAQRSRLDREILPKIGRLPIRDVGAPHLIDLLSGIHARGADEVLAKCRVVIAQVFRHAAPDTGLTANPVELLKGRFPRGTKVVHRRRVESEEMPDLFAALAEVPAEQVTKLALYFLILTAARTVEMRFATWGEVRTLKGEKIWRLSAERMKMDREHIVPLSTQAAAILDAMQAHRVGEKASALIFPGWTRTHGALSENALLALLARAGFFSRQTAHGFRGSFSRWAHEDAEANPDVIELCLAHKIAGDIRSVYNDAKYLPQRRELLQRWADQCEAWGMNINPEAT